MRVHFGEFALDRDSRQLWRGQEELRLVPKAFDLPCGDRAIPLSEGENLLGRVDGAAAGIDSPWFHDVMRESSCPGEEPLSRTWAPRTARTFEARGRPRPLALLDGDEIRLGRVRMTFNVLAGTASTRRDLEP